jgi:Secretion system C-terminal sorting domain
LKRPIYFLVLALSGFTFHASAQYGGFIDNQHDENVRMYPHPYLDRVKDVQKTAGFKSRLICSAWGAYQAGIGFPATGDSIKLTYSAGRSWDTLINEWNYDLVNKFHDFGLPMTKLHDANGRVLQHNYAMTPSMHSKTLYNYSNGRIDSMVSLDSIRAPWKRAAATYKEYDQQGRLVKKYTDLPDRDTTLYIYTTNGLDTVWLSSPSLGRRLSAYRIFVNGRLAEIVSMYSTKSNSSFAYDNSGRVVSIRTIKDKYTSGQSELDTGIALYTYDANGNTESETKQSVKNGSVHNTSRTEWTYNSLGQTTTERSMHWNPTSSTWTYSSESRYYYEAVFPVGLNNADMPVYKNASLYPVPASNELILKFNNLPRTTLYDFVICNMHGRIMRQWSAEIPSGASRQQLDVSQLPAGNYLLHYGAGKENISTSQQFSIVR